MSPRSVLITGCNRGIGLELIKQWLKLANPPTHLIGTYRDPASSEELLTLTKDNSDRLKVLQFDVAKRETYKDFIKHVTDIVGAENGLNLFINNAGYMAETRQLGLEDVTAEDMIHSFEVNCVAPLLLTREFLPLLKAAIKDDQPKFKIDQAASILMSTSVASIAENTGGGHYPYRASKTALNCVMKSLSVDLKKDGILIMSMHPGWVKTRMGGSNAMIDTETCCATMIQTLAGLGEKDQGSFKRYNNEVIPW
jgi:NAD(P)-dependent dehydrogenase (short-subunit alcohol dehydrogenase family)